MGLRDWRKSVKAQMPTLNPKFDLAYSHLDASPLERLKSAKQ